MSRFKLQSAGKGLVVLLAFLAFSANGFADAFTDVPPDPLYSPHIQKFLDRNFIFGETNFGEFAGTFRPHDPITRAEYAKLAAVTRLSEQYGVVNRWESLTKLGLVEAIDAKLRAYYQCASMSCDRIGNEPFTDVAEKSPECLEENLSTSALCQPWYSQYVYYLVDKGVMAGYEDGSGSLFFRPNAPLTRLEALQIILVENPLTAPESDWRYQRLANVATLRGSYAPKCLEGAENYLLDFNGGNTATANRLLSLVTLADRLDLFGADCSAFGTEDPLQRAAYLMASMTRLEAPRFFALTTDYSFIAPIPGIDPTIHDAGRNQGSNAGNTNYQPPLYRPTIILNNNSGNSNNNSGNNSNSNSNNFNNSSNNNGNSNNSRNSNLSGNNGNNGNNSNNSGNNNSPNPLSNYISPGRRVNPYTPGSPRNSGNSNNSNYSNSSNNASNSNNSVNSPGGPLSRDVPIVYRSLVSSYDNTPYNSSVNINPVISSSGYSGNKIVYSQTYDKIKSTLFGNQQTSGGLFSSLGNVFKSIFSSPKAGTVKTASATQPVISNAPKETSSSLWGSFKSGVSSFVNKVGTTASNIGNGIASAAGDVGNFFLKNDNDFIRYPSHFIKGAGESIWGMAEGIWNLGTGLAGGAWDMATHPVETAKSAFHAATHPIETLSNIGSGVANFLGAAWTGLSGYAVDSWDACVGNAPKGEECARRLGNIAVDVGSMFVGGAGVVGKVGKAGKLAEFANIAGKAGKAGKYAEAAEVFSAVGKVGKVGKIASEASWLTKASGFFDDVGKSLKGLAANQAGKVSIRSLIPSNPFKGLFGKAAEIPLAPSIEKFLAKNTGRIEKLRRKFFGLKPAFDDALNVIAKETGTIVKHGSIKSATRIAEKAVSEYGGNINKVKDVLRSQFVVETTKEAYTVLDKVKKSFGNINRFKDTIAAGAEAAKTGYRSIIANVKVARGKFAEIQIVPKSLYDVGKQTHDLYEQARRLSTLAAKSTQEASVLMNKVNQINNKAWNVFRSGLGKVETKTKGFLDNLFGGSKKGAAANVKNWKDVGITPGEATRIQNAANKIQKPINVVGSRAKGTAGALSDWDYVVEGLNANIRGKIKNSLPKGLGGGELTGSQWSGIDILKGPLDKARSYIPFFPKKK